MGIDAKAPGACDAARRGSETVDLRLARNDGWDRVYVFQLARLIRSIASYAAVIAPSCQPGR